MPDSSTRHIVLIIAAILCFVIGLVLAVDWVQGGNEEALLFGGLTLFAAAHLP